VVFDEVFFSREGKRTWSKTRTKIALFQRTWERGRRWGVSRRNEGEKKKPNYLKKVEGETQLVLHEKE